MVKQLLPFSNMWKEQNQKELAPTTCFTATMITSFTITLTTMQFDKAVNMCENGTKRKTLEPYKT